MLQKNHLASDLFFSVLMLTMLMVVESTRIWLSLNSDVEAGLTVGGIHCLAKSLVDQNKTRRFSIRIFRQARSGKFKLGRLSIGDEVYREFGVSYRHARLRTLVEQIDGHRMRRLVVDNFGVIFLISQFNKLTLVWPSLGMCAGRVVVAVTFMVFVRGWFASGLCVATHEEKKRDHESAGK